MKDDGGPAFPVGHVQPRWDGGETVPGWQGREGMSLRDWFAGMALQGWIASGESSFATPEKCYEDADAMLEARKK